MPIETLQAISWALQQVDKDGNPITKDMPHELVEKAREYFNMNDIPYSTFSYDDLVEFFN